MEIGPALLDTDTLSEFCRGNLRVTNRARSYLQVFGRLITTSITVFERFRGYDLAIRQGKPFARQRQAFEGFVSTCIVIPFDRAAAVVAATIWSAIGRAQRTQVGDILIAAVAISRRLPLVTRNKGDFARLSAASGMDLRLVDWTRAETGRIS